MIDHETFKVKGIPIYDRKDLKNSIHYLSKENELNTINNIMVFLVALILNDNVPRPRKIFYKALYQTIKERLSEKGEKNVSNENNIDNLDCFL